MREGLMRQRYQNHVDAIEGLKWEQYTPESIIFASRISAFEFARTLRRVLLTLDPLPSGFTELAKGELETDNMSFADYTKHGDHWEMLLHFVDKNPSKFWPTDLQFNAGALYAEGPQLWEPQACAMTIISRERELPRIFNKILSAHDWGAQDCEFFAEYLRRHIAMDSQCDGHADLFQDFDCDPFVLEIFWNLRLMFYQSALIKL